MPVLLASQVAWLPEKCPNMEFILVRIQENTDQKKSPYLDTFHAVIYFHTLNSGCRIVMLISFLLPINDESR